MTENGAAAAALIGGNSNNSNKKKKVEMENPSLALMKVKTYLAAVRPWSLSASLVPTILGAAIAYRNLGAHEFSLISFFLTIFIIGSVHCAGNVVNTYFDYVKGIDRGSSDDRTLVDHILSQDEVRIVIAISMKSLKNVVF